VVLAAGEADPDFSNAIPHFTYKNPFFFCSTKSNNSKQTTMKDFSFFPGSSSLFLFSVFNDVGLKMRMKFPWK